MNSMNLSDKFDLSTIDILFSFTDVIILRNVYEIKK